MKTIALILLPIALACSPRTVGHTLVEASEYAPDYVTSVTVTLDVKHRKGADGRRQYGKCVPVGDERWLVIHLGEIAQAEGQLVTEAWADHVIQHEMEHARLTCSDSEHVAMAE